MPSNFKALAGASGGEPNDPNFKNVTLLLHGDGSNGAQNNTFLDSSTNNFTITRNGNTTQGSFSPYGSNWSNYFDGTGDYLETPSSSAAGLTGDWTVEAWVFPTSFAAANGLFDCRSGGTGFAIYYNLTGFAGGAGSMGYATNSALVAYSAAVINLNAWNHIAVVRSGNTVTGYANGSSVFTYTETRTNATTTTYQIGVPSAIPLGYFSNMRVVRGTAIYSGSTITVPTAPLTAITNTSLLTCQSNRFRDASTNNFTITRNGDVKVTNFAPFAPSAAYSTTTNGGSAYFDGTGDYISAPYSVANSEWWTQDFTMEMWVYNNTNAVSGSDNVCLQLAHGVPTTADAYWVFGTNASGQVEFLYYNGSVVRLTGTTAAALTAWNHIAMVYTNSTGNISLYLNGSRVATGTKSGTPQKSSGSTINVGVAQNTYYNGYISNLRILDGTALYSGTTYTVPTAPVTAITNTSLLLNATNAAIFDNSMKNDLETVGNAQISTSVKKFGTGSMAFDGSGDYLITPDTRTGNFGTGDFTVEFWWYGGAQPARYPCQVGTLDAFSATGAWRVTTYNDNANNFAFIDGITTYSFAATNYNDSAWHHIAVTRSGTTVRGFVDGVQIGSSATVSTSFTARKTITGGQFRDNGFIQGYIDDLRITRGVARYTANFTPPTAAFANK